MNFVTMILANQYTCTQKNNSLTHTKNAAITTTFSSSFFVLPLSQIQDTHQHTYTDEINFFTRQKIIADYFDDKWN